MNLRLLLSACFIFCLNIVLFSNSLQASVKSVQNANDPIETIVQNDNMNLRESQITRKKTVQDVYGNFSQTDYERFLNDIANDNIFAVEEALEAGMNPNYISNYGAMPLSVAIQQENIEMITLLLENGANVNITNGKGMSIAKFAMHKSKMPKSKLTPEIVSKITQSTQMSTIGTGLASLSGVGAESVSAGAAGGISTKTMLVVGGFAATAGVAVAAKTKDDESDSSSKSTSPEETEIIVAVVDSGVDIDHPNFGDRVLPGKICNPNCHDDGNVTYAEVESDADLYHGTAVTGRVLDANSNAKILPIKTVLIADGNSPNGISYALDNGAKVINGSYGYYRDEEKEDPIIYQENLNSYIDDIKSNYTNVFDKLVEKNAIAVFSAGNDAKAEPGILGAMSLLESKWDNNIISVGAVVSDDNRSVASYSHYAGALTENYFLAVGNVTTETVYDEGTEGAARTITKEGTSFAAPYVSGAFSKTWSFSPQLTPTELLQIYRDYAIKDNTLKDRDGGAGYNTAYHGAGYINSSVIEKTLQVNTESLSLSYGSQYNDGQNVDYSNSQMYLGSAFGNAATKVALEPIMFMDGYKRGFKTSLANSIHSMNENVNLKNIMDDMEHRQELKNKMTKISLSDNQELAFAITDINSTVKNVAKRKSMFMSYNETIDEDTDIRYSYLTNTEYKSSMNPVYNFTNFDSNIYDTYKGNSFLNLLNNAHIYSVSLLKKKGLSFGGGFASGINARSLQPVEVRRMTAYSYSPTYGNNTDHASYYYGGNQKLSYSSSGYFEMLYAQPYYSLYLQSGILHESNGSLMGSFTSGAFETDDTMTYYINVASNRNLTKQLSIMSFGEIGISNVSTQSNSLIQDIGNVITSSFGFGFNYNKLFFSEDELRIFISQPLKVEQSRMYMKLPDFIDIKGGIHYRDYTVNLTPEHRQIDLSVSYNLYDNLDESLNLQYVHSNHFQHGNDHLNTFFLQFSQTY